MKTPGRKHLVIGLVVIAVVTAIASQLYRFIDEGRIAQEATEAKSTAMASASPATLPDDARRWLEANGYRVVYWNAHDPRGFEGTQTGGEGTFRIVQGQRQIRTGGWLVKPTWLNLTFRFDPEGLFHDVQVDPFSMEIPATRPAE